MKCKIEMEVDLSRIRPPSGGSGSNLDKIRTLVVESILQPARAHSQMRRRLPGIFETDGEEVFINRVDLIDQAEKSLAVTITVDDSWRLAFNDWS